MFQTIRQACRSDSYSAPTGQIDVQGCGINPQAQQECLKYLLRKLCSRQEGMLERQRWVRMVKQDSNSFGLYVAKTVTELPDSEWPVFFQDLCRARQLSAAMHELNNLLSGSEHANLAREAIKKMGFDTNMTRH